MPAPTTVLIVDDHAGARRGVAAVLDIFDDLRSVGEAGSGEEALRQCAAVHPDVVLMDLVMPGMDGAQATRTIRARFPEIRIIAITSFPHSDLVQQALAAGALTCLSKAISADELAAAIRAAATFSRTADLPDSSAGAII